MKHYLFVEIRFHLQNFFLLLIPEIIVKSRIVNDQIKLKILFSEPFQYTGAEITIFRIVKPEDEEKFKKWEYAEIRDILEQKKIECEQYCTPDDIDGKI